MDYFYYSLPSVSSWENLTNIWNGAGLTKDKRRKSYGKRNNMKKNEGERKVEGKQNSNPYSIIQLAPLNFFCKKKKQCLFFLGKK